MKKQILLFVLMLLPMVASADDSGSCGDNVNYTYVEATHTLTISGSGPMKDYVSNYQTNYVPNTPWYNYRQDIKSVIILEGVTSIGEYAFVSCSGLTSVTIPNSVTSIRDYAFSGCSSLTSVTIPNSVTSIGNSAFWNCRSLTSVTIPNSVTSIGKDAFCQCSGLTSVTIPNSVTSIGNYAFYGCSGLTSVTIPNSVTSIGDWAFAYCSGLTSVTIPNSVTSIGIDAFAYCSGLTSVTIPNSVTSIGRYAFYNCSGLTSVTIPNSVTSIGGSAFSGCSGLTKIVIGNGIKEIGSQGFASCPIIEDVYCYAVRYPSTNSNAFSGSYPDYITLHVPAEATEQYRAVEPWSKFKAVVAIKPGDPTPDGGSSSGEGTEKCKTPTISYSNGKLTFRSATDGAICQSTISDNDIKSYSGNEVQLSVTYTVKVYAVKSGYQNSDIATATLCWIDVDPKTEGITTGSSQIPSKAVLIQNDGGVLTVQGADDGTKIGVYNINGTLAGEGTSRNGCATVNTNLQPGSVAIIKIGDRSVKVMMK